MAKIADKYFVTDPWNIIEEGFNPEYSSVSESIFSLGNEYMGVRGYFEEGYSGKSLIGSYFNGIYERQEGERSAYKGMVNITEFMVNSVNWLYLRIKIDDEILDLSNSKIKDFKRVLNLYTGVFTRSFVWITKSGKEIFLEFERYLCMMDAHLAGQKLEIKPLNFSGDIIIEAGLDFSNPHEMVRENLWNLEDKKTDELSCRILGSTIGTKQKVFSCCKFSGDMTTMGDLKASSKIVGKIFRVSLQEGKVSTFKRIVKNISWNGARQSRSLCEFYSECETALSSLEEYDYEFLKKSSAEWWKNTWDISDIEIKGDELNQQGIRYCIFQMHQTYHGVQEGAVIGAKGLTGEAYSGNTFWDTETYCLPFYIFNNVKAAKQLLMFRYDTLEEAKKRAKELDCEGAFYPIATISGKECCTLWQHASLQLQATTAVAYGLWHYENVTKDKEFIYTYGIPMLIEIARMLASRGDWNNDRTYYGYYGVMGPDEFQMMVNNNCYTNYLGKETLDYTLQVLNQYRETRPDNYDNILEKYNLTKTELDYWQKISEKMFIPYDEERKIYEQHEGFFHLPHVDVDKIPTTDFPLYHHWTYDRIYRNDMIKQPDVLMFLFLYNDRFSTDVIKKNYEYYTPRCIHESSLSPSVHSILATQIGKDKVAYDFFGFATRMDLDNYNRNTHEGLHTTSIAAAWMNIVYGFGGMRSDGKMLKFAPSIPDKWEGYSFCVTYAGDTIKVLIDKSGASFHTLNGTNVKIKVYQKEYTINGNEIKLPFVFEEE
ncbi:maltose phosphorylase [Mobilisporobacter senegalensis]|uniref:Maltose phosphorylase n=1 Tax=Mobilisporobacter senegalensis TaxID=1329262 RepID=A0A3N1XZX2_9FIRM|nr:glycosyl hydrolase family 65 protein [Mobilisporobacter senegalensis]ROR31828.1 maltose phosphorylase [Mobilisporobacter senegalensis]